MSDWQEIKLKTLITEMGDGGTPTTSEDGNFGGDIPWVVVEDVVPEIYKTKEYLTEKGFKRCSAKLWNEETIILTTGATIGNIGIAKVKLCTKQGITGIVCNEFADNYFLKFWFEANINQLLRYAQGTTFKEIRTRALGNLKIKIPKPYTNESVLEQRTIASILSKVDEAIAATKNSIAKAERLKKALMQNLLTGKLKPDSTWRKEDEFYKDEKFGNIPKGWVYEKLGKLVLKITDGEHISPDMQDKGEYIVSAEDVFDDGVHFEKAKYVSTKDCLKFRKRCDPEFGDVLIVSRGASVGRTCKVQTTKLFCMMGSVILIKPQQTVLTNDFISIYLKTYEAWKELRRISGSSAQQAIYLAHLKKMRIMYPTDVTEQENITKSFEGVYKTILQKEEKLKKLERLKKALMQNLLTGKVRVKVPKEQLQTETR